MSQKIGIAPQYSTAFAVAIYVKEGTITLLSGLMPMERRARCKAVVQLEVANEY